MTTPRHAFRKPGVASCANLGDRSAVRVGLREVQAEDSRNDIGTKLPHCIGDVKSARVVAVQGGDKLRVGTSF